MQNAMIDLETFGTRAGCVLRSIGIALFDPEGDGHGETYYANFREEEQREFGAHYESSTVQWWERQPQFVQDQLITNQRNFYEVADEIIEFIRGNKARFVWGQGANFDSVLLQHSFELAEKKVPWLFYNTSDTRTIYRAAGFDTKSIQRLGTYHNALDDAKHQIRCVQASYRILRGRNE